MRGICLWVSLLFIQGKSWILSERKVKARSKSLLLFVSRVRTTTRCSEKKNAFDFTSAPQWEDYYKEGDYIQEWHSSVPLSDIVQHIPSDVNNVVLLGCGTSELPTVVLEERPRSAVLLVDSSPSCIAIIDNKYNSHDDSSGNLDRVSCYCADAVEYLLTWNANKTNSRTAIVDKGLTDVFLCGHDWERTLRPLVQGVSRVLGTTNGCFILVSYRLSTSMREFLEQASPDLDWQFDEQGTNSRVSVSVTRHSR